MASNDVRLALGCVLSARFDGGHARGSKLELGIAMGSRGRSASNRVSLLLAGQTFPDRELGTIAAFVGLTVPDLLRMVAEDLDGE